MNTSNEIEKLSADLLAAQNEIGGVVKDAKNPFFKSTYADLNSVIAVIKPVYAKHGLTIIQLPCSDEHGVGVTTRLIHKSGEWLEDSFTLPLTKPDPQAAGSAITYAKRYALKALGLMPDVDDDAEGAMFRTTAPFTKEQKESYVALMAAGDGWGLKAFARDVGSEAMDALFNDAPQGQKTKQKELCRTLVTEANNELKASLVAIEDAIVTESVTSLHEIFAELGPIEHEFVMAGLTEVQKTQIADMESKV